MKNLLTLGLVISGTLLGAQSFEWNDAPVAAKGHPKEIAPVNDYDRAFNERQSGLAGVYSKEDDGSRTAYGETYRSTEMTGSHAVLPLGTLLRVTNPANGRTAVVRVTDRGRECQGCLITLSLAAATELGVESGNAVDLERSGFSNWNPVTTGKSAPSVGIVAPQAKAVVPKAAETAPRPSVFTREVTVPPNTTSVQQARGPVSVPPAVITDLVAPAAATGSYSVQLAAYSNEDYALRKVSELKDKGLADVFYRAITKEDGQVINRVYVGNYANVNEAQAAAKLIQGKFELSGIVAKM